MGWWKESWSRIGIAKYINIKKKSLYKFAKKRNKYDVTIKSIMTKSTISGKMVETIEESTKRKTKLERERERVLTFFVMNNLEGIWKRGGKEVKRNL